MNKPDDKNLYSQLKEGNEYAFEQLFHKYYPSLCHFAYQFLLDEEMAREIVQDMFVKIWEKRDILTIETSVRQYLFRSVKNYCINQIQHLKIRSQYAKKVMEDTRQEIDTTKYYLEIDLVEKIEKSIDSLPEKRKEIFRLSREEGLKYKEIAEQLNISIKTVEAQMGLALKYLREELKEYKKIIISFFISKMKTKRNKG